MCWLSYVIICWRYYYQCAQSDEDTLGVMIQEHGDTLKVKKQKRVVLKCIPEMKENVLNISNGIVNGSSVSRCLYGVFSDLLTYWPNTRLRPTQENSPEPLRDESAQLGFAYHALIMPHVLMGPRWITAVLGVYPHGSVGGVGFNRGVAVAVP